MGRGNARLVNIFPRLPFFDFANSIHTRPPVRSHVVLNEKSGMRGHSTDNRVAKTSSLKIFLLS